MENAALLQSSQRPPAYHAISTTPPPTEVAEGRDILADSRSTHESENQGPESTIDFRDLLVLRAHKYLDTVLYLNVGIILLQGISEATGFYEKHQSLTYGLLGVDAAVSIGLIAYALRLLLTPPIPRSTPEQRVLDQA